MRVDGGNQRKDLGKINPEKKVETDFVLYLLILALKHYPIRKRLKDLTEIASVDYPEKDDVIHSLYLFLREKEDQILNERVIYHQSFVREMVKNRLEDLIKKYTRRRRKLAPFGSLDDLAEGERLPYDSPLKECLLREEIAALLHYVQDVEWKENVITDVIVISGEIELDDEVLCGKVEDLKEGVTDVVHRLPIRDVCEAHGLSTSSATRFIRELKAYFNMAA